VEQARLSGRRTLTVSAGTSQLADGQTMEDIVAGADQKLYTAKTAGRNRVV
jgi:PleD family two-component response regulator